ncbi:alcohol dehydrogenase catalytic domain-containing protein [Brachybacterium timonense]|uniref:alcohol dehydrogenase catalytic domain-containing protein n=1 Tax=Brachybacterium timonense TaxID=2050896 RepID=UPI002481F822|nr:alcohol dehydrogenase catalytic domain-containing protein [Brachybacterium timonense]
MGEGVEGLAVGDNVVVEPLMVCGQCPPCRANQYNLCAGGRRAAGVPATGRTSQGGRDPRQSGGTGPHRSADHG